MLQITSTITLYLLPIFLFCSVFCVVVFFVCVSADNQWKGEGDAIDIKCVFRWNMFWLEAMHVPFDGLSMMSCLQQGYE